MLQPNLISGMDHMTLLLAAASLSAAQSIALFAGTEQRIALMKVGHGWEHIASCLTADPRNLIEHCWDRKKGKHQHLAALCVALLSMNWWSIVLEQSKLSSPVVL